MWLTKRLAAFCPCPGDVREPHDRPLCSFVSESRARVRAVEFSVGRYALAYLVVGSPEAIRSGATRPGAIQENSKHQF